MADWLKIRGNRMKLPAVNFALFMFKNNILLYFWGTRINTFETFRDRMECCQEGHRLFPQKPHPAPMLVAPAC
jgi:hypothetical protein